MDDTLRLCRRVQSRAAPSLVPPYKKVGVALWHFRRKGRWRFQRPFRVSIQTKWKNDFASPANLSLTANEIPTFTYVKSEGGPSFLSSSWGRFSFRCRQAASRCYAIRRHGASAATINAQREPELGCLHMCRPKSAAELCGYARPGFLPGHRFKLGDVIFHPPFR